MTQDRAVVDITELPEVARLVEQAELAGTAWVLRRDGRDVAVLTPLRRSNDARTLTHDERVASLTALKAMQAERAAQRARRGGKPLAESWPLIREERERARANGRELRRRGRRQRGR